MAAISDDRVELTALAGLPVIMPGDDLDALIAESLERSAIVLRDGDVVVVTSKLVSRAEGRFVDLATVEPGERAVALAAEIAKDPRLVELILSQSSAISRTAPNVLIVRHRLGFISANAGIDASNAMPPHPGPDSGPWVLLLPENPDAAAASLRAGLQRRSGATIGVVISDSLGRPFRFGTVGAALGVAGVPALDDLRGQDDLFGRPLEHTEVALADQLAAAADLVAGQSAQGRGVVHVRGLTFTARDSSAAELLRPADRDLYA